MRHHRGVAGPFCHLNRFQGFSEGADLVQFYQNRIGDILSYASGQNLGIGDKNVITYKLNPRAEFGGKSCPAIPVIFIQAVFDGKNWILVQEHLVPSDHLVRTALGLCFRFQSVEPVFEKFTGSHIQGQIDVFTGSIASTFYTLQQHLKSFFVGFKIRGKPTFIPHCRAVAVLLQHRLQAVKDLSSHAQSFCETPSSDRKDHELLNIHIVVSMGAAIEHIHHGDG